MLTDEQVTTLRKASAVLCGAAYYDEARVINAILAAHNAEAQEPVAEIVRWLDFTNKPRFDIKVIDETLEHGAKLYSQPMPQTDAARDAKDADMVWPIDDDETFYHSLDDAVEGEINNQWPVEAPLEFEFQVAKRIPNVRIRVTAITENGHEWEIERIEREGGK